MAAASPHKGAARLGTPLTAIVVAPDTHLYAAGVDSSLWRRAMGGGSRSGEWERIGQAVDVVGLAAFSQQIFALDGSSVIWRWDLSGDGQWEAWSEPPEAAYSRGLKGTQWDRVAIGVTTDGHMWAVTGTRQLVRADVHEPGKGWTPCGSRMPLALSVTAMSTSDTRLIITCEDLSVQILETAMIRETEELDWQPFGTTPLRAERGIAAQGQSIYVAGAGGIQVGEFTMMGSLEWKASLPLPPISPGAAPPPAEILREIEGCVGCGETRSEGDSDRVFLCSSCEAEWHPSCLSPPLSKPPEGSWRCPACSVQLDSARLQRDPVRRHMHLAWEAVRDCGIEKTERGREGKSKKTRHRRAQPFLQLPSYTEYPDYYATIARPISLAMVKRRIEENAYRDWHEFAAAMDLVFANARQYNHPESAVVADANKLQNVFDSFKRKVPGQTLQRDTERDRERTITSGKASKRPRQDTEKGTERDRDKAKKPRKELSKQRESEKRDRVPELRTFTIDEEGPLGIKFKDGDSLVVDSANAERVAYKAGVRVGMQLVAFQGAAVSDRHSTMAKIKQTSRPWELTFKVQQRTDRLKDRDRESAPKVPRLVLSAPQRETQRQRETEKDTSKRKGKQEKQERRDKEKERKERTDKEKERKEKKVRFESERDRQGESDTHTDQDPRPLVLKRPLQRETEWVKVSLPPEVEAGEPFVVTTADGQHRQVLFPTGGQTGDSWKFELDQQSGEVVSELQVELTETERRQREAERQQREAEKEDIQREEESFQEKLQLLELEEKNQKPKARMSAFFWFCGAHRETVAAQLPGRVTEQSKMLSQMWKELPRAAQQPYYDDSERDNERNKADSAAWKKRFDSERAALTQEHTANLAELRERHKRQRRGEIVDEDPRSSWSLQTQFDLTSTADIDAHLDRSSLQRCSVGDALSTYMHLRSMETVYGLAAFRLQDFLCGLVSSRENVLLSEIHICLLKVLRIEEINAALADDSGDSDHLLLQCFSVNYHTWPALLGQACGRYVSMPLQELSEYLSPAAGHVPLEFKDDVEQREAEQRIRLCAARELRKEAATVTQSLTEDEYWSLPPATKVSILRFIIDVLVQRQDAKDLTAKRVDEIEGRQHVDSWTGKLSECAICGDGGEIFCCDFCSGAYHLACIRPEMTEEPPEDTQWFCQFCSVEDASATSFTPLGDAHAGARYWFVGGHIFAEDCATGQFAPRTKAEVAELLNGLKTVRAAKRLRTALESRYQHLSEAPIPTELCKALNGLSDEPVPVAGTPLPELRNVSCRYLRPRAPRNHSVHWDFSAESGGAWFWCDTANDYKSQWTNPNLQTGTHTHTHSGVCCVRRGIFAECVHKGLHEERYQVLQDPLRVSSTLSERRQTERRRE